MKAMLEEEFKGKREEAHKEALEGQMKRLQDQARAKAAEDSMFQNMKDHVNAPRVKSLLKLQNSEKDLLHRYNHLQIYKKEQGITEVGPVKSDGKLDPKLAKLALKKPKAETVEEAAKNAGKAAKALTKSKAMAEMEPKEPEKVPKGGSATEPPKKLEAVKEATHRRRNPPARR